MRTIRTAAAAAAAGAGACLATLAACATGGGGEEPSSAALRRPAVTMPDEVRDVDRAKLVGTWTCKELNPIEGRAPITTTVRFNQDGTARNSAIVDMAAQGGPVGGKMAIDYAYTWQVQGERVVAVNPQATVRAADGSQATGFLASLSQFVINRFSSETKPGTMDPLKLTSSELVLRSGEMADGPVLACTKGAGA